MNKRPGISDSISSALWKSYHVLAGILTAVLIGVPLFVCIAWLLGIRFFAVAGSSMEPTLSVGDIVVVDTNKVPEEGSVIVFAPDPSLDVMVTHRVVGVSEEGYATKGDANDAADFKPVAEGNVKGVMIGQIQGAGMIILRFREVNTFWMNKLRSL